MKNLIIRFHAVLLGALILGSTHIALAELPTYTLEVSEITLTSMKVSASTEDNNLKGVTEVGFIWATGHEPDINNYDGKSREEKEFKKFSAVLKDLTPQTTYYVAAYARGPSGVILSNKEQVTTFGTAAPPAKEQSDEVVEQD